MNPFGTGGIGLGRNLQARSRHAGQGGCSPGVANKLTIAIGDAWRDEKRLPIKDYIYQKHNVLRNLCCAPH